MKKQNQEKEQQQKNNKLILVYYVGVLHIDGNKIDEFITKISKKIIPTNIDAEVIFIPIQSYNTRVECINPIYVTNYELIKKHNKLMDEINEQLQYSINNKNDE